MELRTQLDNDWSRPLPKQLQDTHFQHGKYPASSSHRWRGGVYCVVFLIRRCDNHIQSRALLLREDVRAEGLLFTIAEYAQQKEAQY